MGGSKGTMTAPLHHLTLNTGNLAAVPRYHVSQSRIDALLPGLDSGGGAIPGMDGWYLAAAFPRSAHGGRASGSAYYQIADEPGLSTRPIVMAMVAWEPNAAAAAWRQALAAYEAMRPALRALDLWWEPIAAPVLPWLAIWATPHIQLADHSVLGALGRLEADIAWSLIP